MKHIVACVPFARDYVYRKFFMSWTSMLYHSIGKYKLSLSIAYGPYIEVNRDTLIMQAMSLKPDKILFLDDDQTYPADIPEILMNHDKLIVGGVTPTKGTASPMLWDWSEEKLVGIKLWDSLNGQKGLTTVDGMGMGGVMIDPEVFGRIKPPYFKIERNANRYKSHGEDISFYKKCKRAGIDVWVDLDLQYGHLFIQDIRIGDEVRH